MLFSCDFLGFWLGLVTLFWLRFFSLERHLQQMVSFLKWLSSSWISWYSSNSMLSSRSSLYLRGMGEWPVSFLWRQGFEQFLVMDFVGVRLSPALFLDTTGRFSSSLLCTFTIPPCLPYPPYSLRISYSNLRFSWCLGSSRDVRNHSRLARKDGRYSKYSLTKFRPFLWFFWKMEWHFSLGLSEDLLQVMVSLREKLPYSMQRVSWNLAPKSVILSSSCHPMERTAMRWLALPPRANLMAAPPWNPKQYTPAL